MERLIKNIENLLEEFYQMRLATDKRFAGSERREQISTIDKHYAWKIEEVVRQFAIDQQKETREELMSFLDELKKDNEERQNELDKLEKDINHLSDSVIGKKLTDEELLAKIDDWMENYDTCSENPNDYFETLRDYIPLPKKDDYLGPRNYYLDDIYMIDGIRSNDTSKS